MPPRPITILHIEDQEAKRYVVGRRLQQAGYEVWHATTGGEGLRRAAELPDLVLLDIHLPDINGLEVGRRLKSNPATAPIPIVYLSATAIDLEDRLRGLHSGGAAYLTEPVEPAELMALVEALLRLREVERQFQAAAHEWQLMFDAVPDSLALLDAEGRVLRYNRALAVLAGDVPPTGRHLAELLPGLVPPALQAQLQQVMAAGQTGVFELAQADRRYRLRLDPVFDAQGQPMGAVARLADRTAQQRSEHFANMHAALTQAMAAAVTPRQAIEQMLQIAAEGMGWAFASLWQLHEPAAELRCDYTWRAADPGLEIFEKTTRGLVLSLHVGLPGISLASEQPIWVDNLTQERRFVRSAAAVAAGLTGAVIWPIYMRGQLRAVMEFFGFEPAITSEEANELLVDLARQLSTLLEMQAVEAALPAPEPGGPSLAARTAQLGERLARLQSVTEAFSAALTPAEVAQVAVAQGVEALAAAAGAVLLLDPDGRALQTAAHAGYPVNTVLASFSIEAPYPAAEAARTGQAMWVESLGNFVERYPAAMGPRAGTGQQAAAYLPLLVEGRALGTLVLSFRQARGFTPNDRAYLEALASQCAQALERARLYLAEQQARQQAEQAATRTTRLQAVTAALAHGLAPIDVARAIVEHGIRAVQARAGLVLLLRADGQRLDIVAEQGYPPGYLETFPHLEVTDDLPACEAVRRGEPVWLRDNADLRARFPQLGARRPAYGLEGMAALPFQTERRAFGVLVVAFDGPQRFLPEDQAVLLALAQQGAQALERARLYEAEQQARHQAEQAAARVAQLQTATAALSNALTPAEVADAIFNQGTAPLGAVATTLSLLSSQGPWLDVIKTVHIPDEVLQLAPRIPLDARIGSAEVVRGGQPVWVDTADEFRDRYPGMAEAGVVLGFESLGVVPLRHQGRILGTLAVSFAEPFYFNAENRAFLLALAAQCAQAVERARLFAAEGEARAAAEQAAARTAQLQALTAALAAALTVDDVVRAITSVGRPAAGAIGTVVYVLSAGGDRLELAGAPEDVPQDAPAWLPAGEAGPVPAVARTGEAVWLASPAERAQRFPQAAPEAARAQALAVVPLALGRGTLGVVAFGFDAPREFGPAERAYLLAVGQQGAQALERAQLYESLEARVAARTAELERAQAELRAFSANQIETLEQERARIAREAHDELGGALTGLRVQLRQLQRSEGLPPQVAGVLASLSEDTLRIVNLVRRFATDLRPAVLDDLGLAAALEMLASDFERRTGVSVALKLQADEPHLSPTAQLAVYRVVQEALTNVARHADATQVQVVLTEPDGGLELRVVDNGRGMPVGDVSERRSLGLLGMRERLQLVGGQLQLISQPGEGTTVVISVPAAH